jgi:diguanylate cyclase (GGDEF)-like protein/PAS domain S-box-containing protein
VRKFPIPPTPLATGQTGPADNGDHVPNLNHAELSLLLNLGEQLIAELDIDNVLSLVAQTACEVVHAETMAVPMIDFDQKTFTYAAASGVYAAQILGQTFPIHEGACGWVLQHQHPLLFGEGETYQLNDNISWEPGMASSLLVPLICRGRIIGGLSAMGKMGGGAYNPRDLAVLTLFANQASIAIDNARLFRALRDEELRVRLVLDSAGEAIYGIDMEGRCTFANPACLRMLGYRQEADLIGKEMHPTIHHSRPDGSPFPLSECHVHRSVLDTHVTHTDDEVHWRSDGSSFPVEYWSHPMTSDGQILGAVVTFVDISERKQATQQLALVNFAMNHVKEAAYLADEDGRFHFVNDEACLMLGYSREVLLGMRVIDVDHDNQAEEDWRKYWNMTRDSHTVTFESHHLDKDGKSIPVEINANYFEFGGKPYILGLVRDITERKQAEEQIRQLAYFDPLTGLPNRRLLMDRLRQAMKISQRGREFGALLMLDLDHFKVLNDTQGHDAGDRLLTEVAHRLTANVRQEDTVSRLGGDEYVVVAEGLGTEEEAAARQAEMIAEKVRQALGQPYFLSDSTQSHHSTPSIGVTLFHGQDISIDVLLKQADVALYQAKNAGRNAIRFFNPDMQHAIESRSVMENALRRSLQQNELKLYYQPQADWQGNWIGAEVLLRWLPLNEEPIPPARFIPMAEETGLILPIGAWVLEQACAQLKRWEANPLTSTLTIAVNVSARQFHQPDFVEQVWDHIKRAGVNPRQLKLELTESVVLDRIDEVVRRMQQLKALGVGFSLDDFGTGFSSLSYLKQLPLDQVKIDQSFVRDIIHDPNDAAIVRAILAMCQSLGLQVIAEGVETEEQRFFLHQHGCENYQGYLFARPGPVEDMEHAINQG